MKYKIEKKQMGGLIPNYKSQLQMVNRVNNSEVDFIKRLKDPNRQGIPDWTKFNDVASHRMAWATDNKGAVIYPEVQNINNQLIDFTRPPYHTWAGYNSAVQNRDTIRTTPQMAEWFTTNYKKYFPNFKSGGLIPKFQQGSISGPKDIASIMAKKSEEQKKIKTSEQLKSYISNNNYRVPLVPNFPYPKDVRVNNTMFSPSQMAIKNWLEERAPKFKDQLGNGNLQRQVLNLASSETMKNRNLFAQKLTDYVYDETGESKYNDLDLYFDTLEDLTPKDNTLGSYNPFIHAQFAEQGPMFNRGTYQRHESTHASNPIPQINKIKNSKEFTPLFRTLNNEPEDSRIKYLHSPEEIYARLMQLRLDNNFNPNDIWTKKDLEYVRKLSIKNNYELDQYSDDQLLFLLNNVASNNSSSQQVQHAKKGGLIPKHQTGNYLSPLKSSNWLNRPQPEPYSIEKYRPELLKPKENFLDIAIPVIKKFEKFKPNVYKDGKGIPTIGYGETRKEFITKGTMTEQEASDSMREYISNNILPTLTSQPYYGNLNDNQKASLVSLIYNIGQTKFRNSPGLQRALASGNWQEAVKQMDHGYNDPLNPGLRKRRDYERNLFLQ